MPDPDGDAEAGPFFTLNGIAYFAAADGVHGDELWRTDGTTGGTFMVADLAPGAGSSRPGLFVADGDTMYFTAGLGGSRCGLWRSSGTAATTTPIHTFVDNGSLGCFGFGRGYLGPTHLTVVGGIIFFEYFTEEMGQEIWRSDGTPGATILLKDVNPADGAGEPSTILGAAGNRLLFVADDGIHGLELWSSDGTSEGTALLSDIKQGPDGSFGALGDPVGFALGDTLFFAADDGQNGRELWRSDGTAQGTRLVKDIADGPMHSRFTFDDIDEDEAPVVATLGNALLFAVISENGHALWRSDGTAEGTLLLHEFVFAESGFTLPARLTAATGQAFFSVGADELWVTDGTVAGTQPVADLAADSNNQFPLVAISQTLYFLNADNEGICELWRSEAPSGASTLVRRFSTEVWCEEETFAAALGSNVLFSADDGVHGIELFISDGTEVGTRLLKDINPGSERTDDGFSLFAPPPLIGTFNDTLLFVAQDGSSPATLWRSDATSAGTLPIRGFDDVLFGVSASSRFVFWAQENDEFGLWVTDLTSPGTLKFDQPTRLGQLRAIGNQVFASSTTDANEAQLWRASAATGTATLLHTFAARRAPQFTVLSELTEGPDTQLFFVVWTPDAGEELWTSDGSEAGTELVRDINPDVSALGPTMLVRWNDRLYFFANDGVHGTELWQSDGTTDGTTRVTDMLGAAARPNATPVAVGDRLFFFATDEGTSTLYSTDGTIEGSQRVAEVPGLIIPPFTDISTGVVEELLFFPAGTAETGLELWRSDGTANGTRLVREIWPGVRSSLSDVFEWTSLNNRLFFTADDGEHGIELWQSDGTPAGTTLVRDVDSRDPEEVESVTLQPGRVGNLVVFTAFNSAVGRELWQTDGTTGGTRVVHDIADGPLSSDAGEKGYRLVGSTLFFTANDYKHGVELWAVTTDGLNAPCAGDCDDGGTVSVDELVRGVNIALDRQALDVCRAFDTDANDRITVDELVTAVRRTLSGC